MNRRITALLSAALLLCILCGCTTREPAPPSPVPDLTGEWIQPTTEETFCHIATITDDEIKIWWYIPSRDIRELYWVGSFTPPTDAAEPYQWQSANAYTEEEMDKNYSFHRASREEVKTFTYKDGVISYNVTAGHLRLGYTLERADTQSD